MMLSMYPQKKQVQGRIEKIAFQTLRGLQSFPLKIGINSSFFLGSLFIQRSDSSSLFVKSSFSIFMGHALVSSLGTLCLALGFKDFSPMSSTSFIVLHFTFKFVVHCEFLYMR